MNLTNKVRSQLAEKLWGNRRVLSHILTPCVLLLIIVRSERWQSLCCRFCCCWYFASNSKSKENSISAREEGHRMGYMPSDEFPDFHCFLLMYWYLCPFVALSKAFIPNKMCTLFWLVQLNSIGINLTFSAFWHIFHRVCQVKLTIYLLIYLFIEALRWPCAVDGAIRLQ